MPESLLYFTPIRYLYLCQIMINYTNRSKLSGFLYIIILKQLSYSKPQNLISSFFEELLKFFCSDTLWVFCIIDQNDIPLWHSFFYIDFQYSP